MMKAAILNTKQVYESYSKDSGIALLRWVKLLQLAFLCSVHLEHLFPSLMKGALRDRRVE